MDDLISVCIVLAMDNDIKCVERRPVEPGEIADEPVICIILALDGRCRLSPKAPAIFAREHVKAMISQHTDVVVFNEFNQGRLRIDPRARVNRPDLLAIHQAITEQLVVKRAVRRAARLDAIQALAANLNGVGVANRKRLRILLRVQASAYLVGTSLADDVEGAMSPAAGFVANIPVSQSPTTHSVEIRPATAAGFFAIIQVRK